MQARRGTGRTVDVDGLAAGATDQVVVVVTDAVLIAGSRPGRLDASEQAIVDQDAKSVVHPLTRDRTNLGSHGLGYVVCRAVRSIRDRP